jgi:hypothetical protein
MDDTKVTDAESYTELTHTACAKVEGAERVKIETWHATTEVVPERINVRYAWRTQINDTEWRVDAIHLSGPRVDSLSGAPRGSTTAIFSMETAPEWAREFAKASMPKSRLTTDTHTMDEILECLNSAADQILEAVDAPDTGLRDAMNLVVNATAHYLQHGHVGLAAVVEAGYEASLEEVLDWVSDAT